jgi:hypothetical protein
MFADDGCLRVYGIGEDGVPAFTDYGIETNRAFDEITVRRVLQTCCIVGLLVLAFVGLGPATWQPRSGLGWEIDHLVGTFSAA